MPNILAMSFDGELAPSFDLLCLSADRRLPDGWGVGYYPGGEPSASVLKDPAPAVGSFRGELVKAWEHLASSVFLVHIRTATWGGRSDANTQPFTRAFGAREWLFAHSGTMASRLRGPSHPLFEPVGSTDTEILFCLLLERAASEGVRGLDELPPERLRGWLEELNAGGSLNVVLTDGRDVCAYADARGRGGLFACVLDGVEHGLTFGDDELRVDLTRRHTAAAHGIAFASEPQLQEGGARLRWRPLAPGQLIVARDGVVRAEVGATDGAQRGQALAPMASKDEARGESEPAGLSPRALDPSHAASLRAPLTEEARVVAPQRFHVRHRTTYRYERPIERSTHLLRLQPIHDRLQRVRSSDVRVFLDGARIQSHLRAYDDVFGNRAYRLLVDRPYRELRFEAESLVDTLPTDAADFGGPHARSTIPLVWMPWQREALEPYLLPPELPESELEELSAYGMSFVTRNGSDLFDTLLDLNATIHREYQYRPGSTNLSTTAYEVLSQKKGVCQDFTNLFICLARLLGIPARYVCGYVYTGPKHDNPQLGEASHAWAQAYLPEIGWIGFDPTNGSVPQTDHIRVAVGRHYRDATPTSGTIYVGGGPELLEVEVRVDPAI